MKTVIVPHRDPLYPVDTARIDAIVDLLRAEAQHLTIVQPILNEYAETDGLNALRSPAMQAEAIGDAHGPANYLVITGEYGVSATAKDLAYREIRHGFGSCRVTTLMAADSIENPEIISEFAHGCLDYLAVPAKVVIDRRIDSDEAKSVIDYRRADGKLIEVSAVPYNAVRTIAEKIVAVTSDRLPEIPARRVESPNPRLAAPSLS